MDDREDMERLLRRLQAECDASTDRRAWTARVGLAGGAVVELGHVRLDDLPTVVLEDRRRDVVTYTTLRDVVHIELRKGSPLRLEAAVREAREEAAVA